DTRHGIFQRAFVSAPAERIDPKVSAASCTLSCEIAALALGALLLTFMRKAGRAGQFGYGDRERHSCGGRIALADFRSACLSRCAYSAYAGHGQALQAVSCTGLAPYWLVRLGVERR